MTVLAYGLLACVIYVALCAWVVYGRGPFHFAYTPFLAIVLRVLGMQAITLGTVCYVRYRFYLHPKFSGPGTILYRHEKVHADVWRRRPLTFLPEYLWKQVTKGYEHNYFEDDAEKAEDA